MTVSGAEEGGTITIATVNERYLQGWAYHLPNYGGNREIFDDAVQKVREILNGDNDCVKNFFKNKKAALRALAAIQESAEFRSVETTNNTTNDDPGIRMENTPKFPGYAMKADGTVYKGGRPPAAYRVFGVVTVNKDGPFLSKFSKAAKIGNYANGYTRSQVLQLLHELAHAMLDEAGKPLIVDDGTKNNLNQVVSSERN